MPRDHKCSGIGVVLGMTLESAKKEFEFLFEEAVRRETVLGPKAYKNACAMFFNYLNTGESNFYDNKENSK